MGTLLRNPRPRGRASEPVTTAGGLTPVRNWFERGGQAYARFRPEYPVELGQFLASVSPRRSLAVDVGCGSGQLTRLLAMHFDQVLGLDPSADQVAHATPHKNIRVGCAAAESIPVADRSVDLVTAAQAAHWFDLPRFYGEVRRIAAPDGVIALVSYGVLRMDGDLNDRFARFYTEEIGPYWPPERHLVDTGYAELPFPFREQAVPTMDIRLAWTLEELLGYVSTWSAVRRLAEAGRQDILQRFAADMASLWGDPERVHNVSWPIHMRLGAC